MIKFCVIRLRNREQSKILKVKLFLCAVRFLIIVHNAYQVRRMQSYTQRNINIYIYIYIYNSTQRECLT